MGHQLNLQQVTELEDLMKEYPDWKEQFPDIATQLNPPRFHKSRNLNKVQQTNVLPRRSTTVPASDYQAKFQYHDQRPRSSKRPPPTPMEPHKVPMSFSTNMKSDFVAKDLRARPDLIKLKETYEHPTGPFQDETSYSKSYQPNDVQPSQTVHSYPGITAGQMKTSAGTFDSRTTNKDHYKKWNHKPALKFTELPTFTGSILYPDIGHNLESTMKNTYLGARGSKADLIRNDVANIQLEGDHDMKTTSHNTYKSFEGARPAEKFINKPQIVRQREPFLAQTQTMKDYAFKPTAKASKAIAPHPETIKLSFDNKQSFATEARSNYSGIDVTAHPPPKLCVPHSDSDSYPVAEHNIEMESQARRDYRAHDLSQAYIPPVLNQIGNTTAFQTRQSSLPKFNAETSNGHFYKKWHVEPRKRFIDFHEGHKYIPPQGRFEAQSTTKSTFLGKPGKVSDPYLPVENSMTGEGDMDMETMYKVTFNNRSQLNTLQKGDMNNLLNNLRRRKNQEGRFQEQQVKFAQGVGN